MKHEVVYDIECQCGESQITFGISDDDITVKNDIDKIECIICNDKIKLKKYKVKVL